MVATYSVHTSQRTQIASFEIPLKRKVTIRKTSQLMLYCEIIIVYCKNYVKHKHMVWAKFILFSVKPGDIYANH
jgi:hypothetical protein